MFICNDVNLKYYKLFSCKKFSIEPFFITVRFIKFYIKL